MQAISQSTAPGHDRPDSDPFGILTSFQDTVVDVWQNGLYGINIGSLATAVGIFLLFMMIRGLFTRVVIRRITAYAARTTTDLDDAVVEALQAPIRFIPVVIGVFAATSFLDLNDELTSFAANINRSLIAFTIFWIFFRASEPVGKLLYKADRFLTESMIIWLSKAIKLSFVLLGGATILEIWGIQVGPLIAGLGLFGVAIALGAQDLFKNLIAGLFVIGERRFHPGDWILVRGVVEGTVEHIGFRTTTIVQFDKAPVYVPNTVLSDQSVTNFSRMSARRIKWVIGLRYDASAEQLEQVRDKITRYITDNSAFVQPEETSTFVRIDAFGAYSVDILLYCFTRTTNWLAWLEVKEELLLKIKRIVKDAGTDFAYPSQSLYIEHTTEGEAPERPAL